MADSFYPNFIKVALDGTISYDFAGHISARGVDLIASTSTTPPEDRKVRWLRGADAQPVAWLSAIEDGPIGNAGSDWTLDASAGDPAFAGNALAELLAENAPIGTVGLTVQAPAAGAAFAAISAGVHLRKLFDSDADSDFVQSLDGPGLRIIGGTIDTTGAGTITRGSGFGITRNAVGNVTVNFTDDFTSSPFVLVCAEGGTDRSANLDNTTPPSISQCRIRRYIGTTAAASDGTVHFAAFGIGGGGI